MRAIGIGSLDQAETTLHKLAKQLNTVVRRMDHPNRRPRDAATLIVVDRSGGTPKILMGRRHEGHVFMPGKFVFPGGRVDPGDARIAVPDRLDPEVERKLLVDMKGQGSARRAQAIALAAIRETWEETGLLIGVPGKLPMRTRSPAWRGFAASGLTPPLSALAFVCRAITPPRRPRRYDTRFFCISAEHVARRDEPADAELLDLHWLSLSDAMGLDLPPITKVVLEELRDKLDTDAFLKPGGRVPYYYMRNRVFLREEL